MLTRDVDGVVLAVRVKPRASTTKIDGERAGRLQVSVTAPPVDGRANEAVCRVLAKALKVAPTRVTVLSGERGRDKLLRIDGLDAATASERLADAKRG